MLLLTETGIPAGARVGVPTAILVSLHTASDDWPAHCGIIDEKSPDGRAFEDGAIAIVVRRLPYLDSHRDVWSPGSRVRLTALVSWSDQASALV